MTLYELTNKLAVIKERPFKLEREIQKLTEDNLKTVFGLDLVRSESSSQNFRIDTLAFDKETNSFVIIEYKRDKTFSVIDQGYAYLSQMLNNKSDFILEYNEVHSNVLKRNDVDWSQSKVIFVSPSFTTYQKAAINFKDLPIELWEIKRYENGTISYEQIPKSGAKESIKTISKRDNAMERVAEEIKVYTEQEHLKKANDEIKELYERLKNAILNLGEIEVKPKKHYLAFVSRSNVVDVRVQKNTLKMWINLKKGELDDPKRLTRDVSGTGTLGNGDYELQITSDENLEYILSLIKQSVRKNRK
jgi:predicted transport protein